MARKLRVRMLLGLAGIGINEGKVREDHTCTPYQQSHCEDVDTFLRFAD